MPMPNPNPQPSPLPPNIIRRDAMLDVREADGDTPAVVSASVSSDKPLPDYMRWNDTWQEVRLSLDHSAAAIDAERIRDGLVIRDGHYGDQIGLIRTPKTDGKRLYGDIEWCSGERAREIAADCAKKLRRSVSVEAFLDLDSIEQIGTEGEIPVLVCRKWSPTGAAITSNPPADTSIGIARETKPLTTHRESNNMPAETETKTAPPAVQASQPEPVSRDIGKEVVEILQIARAHNVASEIVDESIAKRETPEQFQARAFRAIQSSSVQTVDRQRADEAVKFEQKDLRNYNILRAIRSMTRGAYQDAGFEREISDHIAKAMGRDAQGIYVPAQALVRRDLQTDGTGGNLVDTALLTGSFIDLLRNKPVVQQLGATMLTGLSGDIAIPEQTGAATAYWVSEGNAPTESTPTLKQVKGTPHTVGAYTDISRRMLLQSSMSAQAFVTQDITKVLSLAIDLAALAGTGASGQPKGLLSATGINTPSVTAGTPTYAEMLGFVSDIQTDNADIGMMKWVWTPEVWAKLAATARGTGDGFLLDPGRDGQKMFGYDYITSNQVSANTAIFGVWSELVVAMWGALDLKVDEAALATSGGIRVIGLQDIDILCRHAEAFAYAAVTT